MKADLESAKLQRSQFLNPQERSIVEILKETEMIVSKEDDLKVSKEEVDTTLKVLSMLKDKAKKKSTELETKIKGFEDTLQ